MLLHFFIVIAVVGMVTAGLKIRFDRFFTILMLMFVAGFDIKVAVDMFLWVIMLGALMILLENKDKIAQLPKPMKIKMFVLIPTFTLIASFIGSWLFVRSSDKVLIITLGVLAVLYGLRLMFIHFQEHELKYEEGHPTITKICGMIGPWFSGFFVGFIGTSVKPLKIPFAIRVGKMNVKKVYLGNVFTTFFSSIFAIFWHYILSANHTPENFYNHMIYAMAVWTGIHVIYELTNLVFSPKWQKPFQIVIGLTLVLVSIKIFALAM